MNKKVWRYIVTAALVIVSGCSLQPPCELDEHWLDEEGVCEKDELDHCGPKRIICSQNYKGWADGKCENGKCVAMQCKEASGYKLVDGRCQSCGLNQHWSKEDDSVCVEDTIEDCGNAHLKCEEAVYGWLSGTCEAGRCVASSCYSTHRVSSDGRCEACGDDKHGENDACVPDDPKNCGAQKYKCIGASGWNSIACKMGKCMPGGCEDNYKLNEADGTCELQCPTGTHVNNDNCEEDSASHCGYHDARCKELKWEDGQCVNGKCEYTACQKEYVLEAGTKRCVPSACQEGSVQIAVDDEMYCAKPIDTAEDLIALRDVLLDADESDSGKMVKALEAAHAIYLVKNTINLGKQSNWHGIGTTEIPFSGMMVGQGNARIEGDLTCQEAYCGVFGYTAKAVIRDIDFKINLTSEEAHSGRVAGAMYFSRIKNVRVEGEMECSGQYVGGVSGGIYNSDLENVESGGTLNGTWTRTEVNDGGIGGIINDSVLKNCSCVMDVYTEGNRTGGIAGTASRSSFDDVGYIGIIGNREEGLTPILVTVGGFIGLSGSNSIVNSRVIAQIRVRDDVGGFIGSNEIGGMTYIKNSFALTKLSGENYVAGFVGRDTRYNLENVYSIGIIKNEMDQKYNFCGFTSTTSLSHGYYDPVLTPSIGVCATISKTGTITYFGEPRMPKVADELLVNLLNKNVSECSTAESECRHWVSDTVDLSQLLGMKINIPWQVNSITEFERAGIEKLEKKMTTVLQD